MIGCLNQDCKGIAIYRGLCLRHYNRLKSLVRRRKKTWRQLEAANLCKPCIRGKDGKLRPQRGAR